MPKVTAIKGIGPELRTLLPEKHAVGTLAVDSNGVYAMIVTTPTNERIWVVLSNGLSCNRLLDARILSKGEGVSLFQD